MKPPETVDALMEKLAAGGAETYFGEPVTVLEHSLQAAWFMQRRNSAETQVAAALLHDLGHLMHDAGEEAAAHGIDTHHEELAADALAAHLPATVLDPIRLHVAAKRYLCFAQPRYLATLSPASLESLALQGGPMTEREAEAFLQLPFAREAVALRHADDAAKMPGLAVPALETYRTLLVSLWR